jgi:hypothetical protein
MRQLVTGYEIQYNLNANNGVIGIQLQDGSKHGLNVNSDQELLLILSILSKSPVDYDPTTSIVNCGPRPVGT